MENEIEIINKIIREAIIHGSDSGGSYEQNEEELTDAVIEWLKLKNLADRYIIAKVDTGSGWIVHQIVQF